jgi:two-component system OmpR family response regulator
LEASLRLLVVEDDPDLNRQLTTALTDAGYVVDRAFDGEEGHYLGDSEPYDAVVLDIGLPKMDGISVLEAWRRNGRAMPVLILTARDRWSDKVQGFDAGADDYVAKPFHLEEILARIRALLRRSSADASKVLAFGDVQVDLTRRVVTRKDEELKLTRAEYNLLTYFLQNPDRALTRDMILNSVWGYESFPNTRTVDAHVVRLRQKLEPDAGHPTHFLTVHGVGYRFLP